MVREKSNMQIVKSKRFSKTLLSIELSVDFPDRIIGGGLKPSPSQESLHSLSSGSPLSRKDLSPNNDISYSDKIARKAVFQQFKHAE